MTFLFAEAFTVWGSPTTWLEITAVVLALAMVACNIRQIHWGWPLAIISSLMYFALFWRSKLYGDVGAADLLRGRGVLGLVPVAARPPRRRFRPQVSRLTQRGLAVTVAACALLWPATGLFLKTYTDTDVPWWDAFPTAVSLVGQFLLGRKFIENWAVWIVVNVVSVALFAYKGLWLTVGLYAVFIALSAVGWRAWKRAL